MVSRKQEIRLQIHQFLDALILGLTLWLCHALRYNHLIVLDSLPEIPSFREFAWMLAVIMPFGPLLLELQGFYHHVLEKPPWKSLAEILRAGAWLVLILGLFVIFMRWEIPSRSVLILFALAAPAALLLKERIFVWYELGRLRAGGAAEEMLLAGERDKMEEIANLFTSAQRLEMQVVECVNLEDGVVERLVEALHRHNVGRVILAFSRLEMDKVQRAIEACEVEGVEAWLSADFIHTSIARPTYEVLGHKPMLVFRTTPEVSWTLMVKALVDRLGALIAILVFSPVFLAAALAVRFSSPGKVIFTQKRAGLYGRPFTMYKFRTMCSDAEMRQAELQAYNVMNGPVFKVESDPRVTPVGGWLRKTSIDELPQLFNVLRGEMSLVGPRPLPIYEVEKFECTSHRRRLSMKPGLTCLWQIAGRNEVKNFEDWVRLDLEYIDNWSLGLDLYILVRTVPVVFTGLGAK